MICPVCHTNCGAWVITGEGEYKGAIVCFAGVEEYVPSAYDEEARDAFFRVLNMEQRTGDEPV